MTLFILWVAFMLVAKSIEDEQERREQMREIDRKHGINQCQCCCR